MFFVVLTVGHILSLLLQLQLRILFKETDLISVTAKVYFVSYIFSRYLLETNIHVYYQTDIITSLGELQVEPIMYGPYRFFLAFTILVAVLAVQPDSSTSPLPPSLVEYLQVQAGIHWRSLTVTVLTLAVFHFIYTWLFPTPYELENEGFSTRKRRVKKKPAMGERLPPYPNGWFTVMESKHLGKGQSRHLKVLGRHIAVFRGLDGKVGVVDAYCPHLGANLGEGGIVKKDCIQCPFHGWTFNRGGKCIEVPYSSNPIPSNAHLRSWEVQECNDQILIWFDAESREPLWQPPRIEQVERGQWQYRGKTTHFVNAHIQVRTTSATRPLSCQLILVVGSARKWS